MSNAAQPENVFPNIGLSEDMTTQFRVAMVMGKMLGGGVESVVMNYYRSIDRSKVQFDFLVDSDSSLVPRDEIEALGGRVIEIPPYQRVAEYQMRLCDLFEREGWPIVHSHINALSVFPLRAAKRAGVPVRIAHSHSTSGKGEHAKNALKALLRTQANRYPTHRIACSKLAGDWLFGKGADYTVMRNAVDLSVFGPDAVDRDRERELLGVTDGQLLVGHIGRFMEQKNHAFLLEVFKELLKLRPNSVLALAGDGPLLERTRDRVHELGLDKSVLFLGTRTDVPSLYRAFDVFCLPSLYEGLPMVGIECQAAQTPILTSDTVTAEAAATSLMEFESLESDPGVWARRLLRMVGKHPSGCDLESIRDYDIASAASKLLSFYRSAMGEHERTEIDQ